MFFTNPECTNFSHKILCLIFFRELQRVFSVMINSFFGFFDHNRKLLSRRKTEQRKFLEKKFVDSGIVKTSDEFDLSVARCILSSIATICVIRASVWYLSFSSQPEHPLLSELGFSCSSCLYSMYFAIDNAEMNDKEKVWVKHDIILFTFHRNSNKFYCIIASNFHCNVSFDVTQQKLRIDPDNNSLNHLLLRLTSTLLKLEISNFKRVEISSFRRVEIKRQNRWLKLISGKFLRLTSVNIN